MYLAKTAYCSTANRTTNDLMTPTSMPGVVNLHSGNLVAVIDWSDNCFSMSKITGTSGTMVMYDKLYGTSACAPSVSNTLTNTDNIYITNAATGSNTCTL